MAEDQVVSVLVVDDDPFVRAALRALLDSTEGLSCVGESEDGAQVESAIVRLRPDVVLIDIEMPGMDGTTAIRRVRSRIAELPPMIVLSNHVADVHVLAALQAGASSYLDKGAGPEHVATAVRLAAAGEAMLSPSVTRAMIAKLGEEGLHTSTASDEWRTVLTRREAEIATAVAAGLSNQQIADELVMSLSTVKTNVSRILMKQGLTNRVQIALVVHGITARE